MGAGMILPSPDLGTLDIVLLDGLEQELDARKLRSPEDLDLDEGVFAFRHRSPGEFRKHFQGREQVLLDFIGPDLDFDRDTARGDFFSDVLRVVEGYQQDGTDTGEVWLPLFEVHRPPVDGCETEARFSMGQEKKGNLRVMLLGLKYGGHCKFSQRVQDKVVVDRHCVTHLCPATLTFKRWIYPGLEPYIKPIYSIADIRIDAGQGRYSNVIKGEHRCQLYPSTSTARNGEISLHREVPPDTLKSAQVDMERKDTVGKMLKLTFSLRTTDHPDGIDLMSFGLETEVLLEYGLTFRLAEDYAYRIYRDNRRSARYWCDASHL